jgi:hypothetical protein
MLACTRIGGSQRSFSGFRTPHARELHPGSEAQVVLRANDGEIRRRTINLNSIDGAKAQTRFVSLDWPVDPEVGRTNLLPAQSICADGPSSDAKLCSCPEPPSNYSRPRYD